MTNVQEHEHTTLTPKRGEEEEGKEQHRTHRHHHRTPPPHCPHTSNVHRPPYSLNLLAPVSRLRKPLNYLLSLHTCRLLQRRVAWRR